MALATSSDLGARQAAVRRALAALSLDALIVTTPANVRYLSNHAGSAGILIVSGDGVSLLVDARYQEAVRVLQASPSACPSLTVWPVPGSYDEALLDCLAHLGAGRVGFEARHLTVARHEWLTRTASSRQLRAALRATDGLVEQARVVKDQMEVAALREAARRLTPVADAAFSMVRPGVSERAVAARIERVLAG